MLVELNMRNFALIPALTIPFEPGFNVFTGETGAGKSIIVEGLNLLLGGRASQDYIRFGETKAEIEGMFILPPQHPGREIIEAMGIHLSDSTVILRREISTTGRNVARINGRLVTITALREVGETLLQIQDQHEQHLMLAEANHLAYLDRFGGQKVKQGKDEYQHLFEELVAINRALNQSKTDEQELAQRIDFLKFQQQEIAASQLEVGEEERLEKEKRIKGNAQKLSQNIQEAIASLSGEGRALEALGVSMQALERSVEIDEALSSFYEQVVSCYYQLEDVISELHKYYDQIEYDPEALTRLESRLAHIEQLKRKYGQTIADILNYAEKIEAELAGIERRTEQRTEWLAKKEKVLINLSAAAKRLTHLRQEAADRMVQAIKQQLADLYMDEVQMDIKFSSLTSGIEQVEWDGEKRWLGKEGWDHLEWLISSNPGEPLKALSKIASGGELTRILLSLKTVLAHTEDVTTLLFDEIDTGVSGRVAQAMAEKLYAISLERQVICITHQPQVAAMADHHLYIKKETNEHRTATDVTVLDIDQRKLEIARMMSGHTLTAATKEHVDELLKRAREIKADMQSEFVP